MPEKKRLLGRTAPKPSRTATSGQRDLSGGEAIRAVVDGAFESQRVSREAIHENLSPALAVPIETARRAREAFANFHPRQAEGRATADGRIYWRPGVDLQAVQRGLIDRYVEEIPKDPSFRNLRFKLSDQLKGLVQKGDGDTQTLDLSQLLPLLEKKWAEGVWPASIAMTECKAEIEASRRLQKILGEEQSDTTVAAAAGPRPGQTPPAPEIAVARFVKGSVELQMETASSPESELRYGVQTGSAEQLEKVTRNIQTFQLRAGPSDVTSYHDFSNLQIAFKSVWTEVFDGRLASVGRQLYEEYVKVVEEKGDKVPDRSISTLDDLKALMEEVRDLGRVTVETLPPELQPPSQGAGSGVDNGGASTGAAMTDIAGAIVDPASAIDDPVVQTIVDVLNPVGWLIGTIFGTRK